MSEFSNFMLHLQTKHLTLKETFCLENMVNSLNTELIQRLNYQLNNIFTSYNFCYFCEQLLLIKVDNRTEILLIDNNFAGIYIT